MQLCIGFLPTPVFLMSGPRCVCARAARVELKNKNKKREQDSILVHGELTISFEDRGYVPDVRAIKYTWVYLSCLCGSVPNPYQPISRRRHLYILHTQKVHFLFRNPTIILKKERA